jgi:3-methyladenine DNA glycosylase AlkC
MAALLKELYNASYIDRLSEAVVSVYDSLDRQEFKEAVFDTSWQKKELKERMRHIAATLHTFLPDSYETSITLLKEAYLRMPTDKALENMIFQDFVELYGLDHFELSMKALEHFTQHSSSEFAVRQFILRYPNETMKRMRTWTDSPSEHTRRLASEGCRPRLPWAVALPQFKKDPTPVLEILERLKEDPSRYVQKSVANNLNDISKDNPNKLKAVAKVWLGESKSQDWIIKHACRTLLKAGDQEVMQLFGYDDPNAILIKDFSLDQIVPMGEALHFSFGLSSNEALGKLRIEYAITFKRANNKSSTKVFKISEGDYQQNTLQVTKSYSFHKITTRRYYSGEHALEIIINGVSKVKKVFELVE